MTNSTNGDLKASRSEYQIPLRRKKCESQYSRSSSDSTTYERSYQNVQITFNQSVGLNNVDQLVILAFGNCLLITDGHHRAYQALLASWDTISAEWDRDGDE